MMSQKNDSLINYVVANEALFWKLFTLPNPIVACVNGHAIAGGMALLAACDYVVSNGEGKIGMNEISNGFVLPFKLTEILRFRSPGRPAWTAIMEAQLYSMETAKSLGFVHEIVSSENLLGRAIEKAEQYSKLPLPAYRAMKKQMQRFGQKLISIIIMIIIVIIMNNNNNNEL
jgi:enoyl-CoA hydratase/carnithine racemase